MLSESWAVFSSPLLSSFSQALLLAQAEAVGAEDTEAASNSLSQVGGSAEALGAMAITVFTIVFLLRLRKQRKQARERAKQAAAGNPKVSGKIEREMRALETLMVHVQEVTRECAASLQNRTTALEHATKQAEAAITKLESLTPQANTTQEPAPQPNAPVIHTQPAVLTRSLIAAHPQTKAQHQLQQHTEPAARSTASHPLAEKIEQLADQGQSPVAIAQELGTHAGTVELILSLRRPA